MSSTTPSPVVNSITIPAPVPPPPTLSGAGRQLGRRAGRAGIQALSRISETGESRLSGGEGGDPSAVGKLVDETKQACRTVAASKVGVVIVVFLLTFVLLCAVNPPMAQDRSVMVGSDPPPRCWKKITGWSTLAAVLALCLPFACKFVKKDK